MAELPISTQSLINLSTAGVPPTQINFKSVTLDSDKAVCVRTDINNVKELQIISLANGTPKKFPIPADAAILSPEGKIVAVRVGAAMQLFNLELNSKMKAHKMDDSDIPLYWTWVSNTTIGIVTATKVYHWSSEGADGPKEIFTRTAHLDTQVTSYCASPDQKWLMVGSLKPRPGMVPEGCMELYSVDNKRSNAMNAYAGLFTTLTLASGDKIQAFAVVNGGDGTKPAELRVIELNTTGTKTYTPAPAAIPVPADAAADFFVSTEYSPKHSIFYITSKMGYVYAFDALTVSPLGRIRASEQGAFATVIHSQSSGLISIAPSGQLSLTSINEQKLVAFVKGVLRNDALAASLALRFQLPGAVEMLIQSIDQYITAGDSAGAIRAIINSPGGSLRIPAVLSKLNQLPPIDGKTALMKYLAEVLEKGKLNGPESVEIGRTAVQQGKAAMVEKLLTDGKLTPTEELGDLLLPSLPQVALNIYLQSGTAHEKVINALLNMGKFEQIVPYALKHSYRTNFMFILQNLVHSNPAAAEAFAKQLVKEPAALGQPPLVEIPAIIEVFAQFQKIAECTSFLVDVLAEDKPEQGPLQTRLLELNLIGGQPQMAHTLLGSNMFHHFDKVRIAQLCEKAQLFQRALELYSDIKDIKRVLMQSSHIDQTFLLSFFSNFTADVVLECLADMLKNPVNETMVVKIATQFSEQLTPEELIRVFENAKMPTGLYYYLGSIVNSSDNKIVHNKYIIAAAGLKQYTEVERVCRDSTVYDPVLIRDFLIKEKLQDPRALIHVCDRNGFIDELTSYLWNNDLKKFIEVYIQKVAPAKTPQVIGKLLDLDAEEDFLKNLLDSVRGICPVEPLVEEIEKRNRLRLLLPWLENRLHDGAIDAPTHNALGKIYITLNKEPQQWLTTNIYYDSKVVGKFCEKLDPYLAFLAYKRAQGSCDEELIAVTTKNGLFKDLARYLVERQDLALWASVLDNANPHRKEVIDQVTSTALPETKSAEEVSTTVKAFMAAQLPTALLGLLEKLVLSNGDFQSNRNLQNLLLITSIQTAHEPNAVEGRTMEYINRLDNFDGKEIAEIALRPEYQLFEEAFAIYKKFSMHVEAVNVLIDNMDKLEKASEFAQTVDVPQVWCVLAAAYLRSHQIKEAVDALIHAQDTSTHEQVIAAAEAAGKFEDLVRYLEMVRKTLKERAVDSALAYALAQTGRLAELQTLISSPNTADIQNVGDRAFEEGLYEAARTLYTGVSNYPKLASTLVALGLFKDAVDAAKKANSVRTWKEVSAACVRAGEFSLAQVCGLHIITSPDHMEDLLQSYESQGHWEHLITLLEQGATLDTAHQGIFTELCVLYSRYRPAKLFESLRLYNKRLNISKVLRACEAGRHWPEAVYLLCDVDQPDYDQGVRVMMEHSPVAFNHTHFLEVITKVRNTELHYSALAFYLEEEPNQLASLLTTLQPKLDHARVVHQFKKTEALPLIQPYLRAVQKANNSTVNEALNALYVEQEDLESLKASIDTYNAFDAPALAAKLEKHELLVFRKLASLLFTRLKRWETAISLAKKDEQYDDAIASAAASKDRSLCEDLVKYFANDVKDKAAFAAALTACYGLIRPDVALEYAWKNQWNDYVMPFMIQFMRDTTEKIDKLEKGTAKAHKEEEHTLAPGGMHAPVLALTDVGYGYSGMGAPVPVMGGMGIQAPGMGGFVPPPTMGGMGVPQHYPGQGF